MADLSTSTATRRQPSAADLSHLIERRREMLAGFEPYVSSEVAAEYIGVPPETIKKFAREGAVPAHPVSDESWRFLISELDLWMSSRLGAICL